jgi:hypothetical protein
MFEPQIREAGMAETPLRTVRVPAWLESDARSARPDLAALDFATLARVGLAVLAGMTVPQAIKAQRTRPGPKPREGAAA